MKKKVLSAFLLAGALVVAPMGGGLLSTIATASSNNSGSNVTASSNNPGSSTSGSNVTASSNNPGSNTSGSNTSGSNTPGSNTSGSNTPGSSISQSIDFWEVIENASIEKINSAESGDVVEFKGITTLSNAMMKALLKKGDVTLVLKYTYKDVDYVVTIPAGAAVDNDIPWYGPLYLAAQYGNGVSSENEVSTYTVRPGDTMNKIAAANNMTLAELAAKNPQVKNVNLIRVGQKITIK